ncbi:MAG: hypothetical protein K2P43_12010 [Lachnospiraceae bacterium]|jgi:hypothetical protein|nr:hypothetical protein [Lachnospiraceae bacterium]MCI9599183.1 hypothetical protein [Lachnospiraceae bacterium]MDE6896884.1 hypothetical protein [Lachnospiraceae bacterium]
MAFDGLFNLIDIMVLGFGFYAMYSAWVLQREGKILRTFLALKDTDLDSCKDLQGYANYIAPKLWALGIVMVVYAGISLLNTYVVSINSLFWMMMAVFLITLFWYGMEVKKAVTKYF